MSVWMIRKEELEKFLGICGENDGSGEFHGTEDWLPWRDTRWCSLCIKHRTMQGRLSSLQPLDQVPHPPLPTLSSSIATFSSPLFFPWLFSGTFLLDAAKVSGEWCKPLQWCLSDTMPQLPSIFERCGPEKKHLQESNREKPYTLGTKLC